MVPLDSWGSGGWSCVAFVLPCDRVVVSLISCLAGKLLCISSWTSYVANPCPGCAKCLQIVSSQRVEVDFVRLR